MSLDDARSRSRGTLDDASIRKLASLFREPHLAEQLLAQIGELDNYDGDVLLYEGNLNVRGDFSTRDAAVLLLVVRGDLVIDGSYQDFDDPASVVLVTGRMIARDMVTAGSLEVHGDLVVTGSILGDYNHGGAWIGGNMTCTLFYPEEHFFTLGGELRAKHVVGNAASRLTCATPIAGLEMDDLRLLDLFDRELLNVNEDESGDEVLDVDGFEDFGALKKRVLAGRPLKT